MKKNKLATFLFSLVPGAGEMYYGMYKSGCSIMGLFMGLAALAIFLQMEEVLFGLPIIWFYSFCHVHNIKNMDAEAFAQEKDEVLFGQWVNPLPALRKSKNTYAHKLIAGLLLAVGGIMVWSNLCDLLYLLPIHHEFYYFLQYRFPQLVLGVLIVLAGIWLIRGKKAELEQRVEEETLDSIFERDFHPEINPVAGDVLQNREDAGIQVNAVTIQQMMQESQAVQENLPADQMAAAAEQTNAATNLPESEVQP